MAAYLDELNFSASLSELPFERPHSVSIEDSAEIDASSLRASLISAQEDLAVLRANKALLAKALIELKDTVDLPEAIFKITKRKPSESLSTSKIRKLFPELVSEFEETKTSWDYSFPFLEEANPERSQVSSVQVDANESDPLALHDAYLETWSSIAKSQWDFQRIESQLLSLCGSAFELVDDQGVLVQWEQKSRISFSKAAFQEKYPAEASQCMSQTAGGESVAIAEWRAY
jgi:hypothetical protein